MPRPTSAACSGLVWWVGGRGARSGWIVGPRGLVWVVCGGELGRVWSLSVLGVCCLGGAATPLPLSPHGPQPWRHLPATPPLSWRYARSGAGGGAGRRREGRGGRGALQGCLGSLSPTVGKSPLAMAHPCCWGAPRADPLLCLRQVPTAAPPSPTTGAATPARLSDLSDDALLAQLASGTLSVHTLETALGDCTRAVLLRRRLVAGRLHAGATTQSAKTLRELPFSAFDEELFYKSVLGSNCEAVIGCVACKTHSSSL